MLENLSQPLTAKMLLEIELVHEKMYAVFYNNYYYSYVSHIRVKLIKTDVTLPPLRC